MLLLAIFNVPIIELIHAHTQIVRGTCVILPELTVLRTQQSACVPR